GQEARSGSLQEEGFGGRERAATPRLWARFADSEQARRRICDFPAQHSETAQRMEYAWRARPHRVSQRRFRSGLERNEGGPSECAGCDQTADSGANCPAGKERKHQSALVSQRATNHKVKK